MIRTRLIILVCLLTIISPSWAQVINPEFELTAPDMVQNGGFGYSIAINEELIAVGSYSDSSNGFAAGSAYLFVKATREQLRKLVATDAGVTDSFGASVGFSGSVLYVGAPNHDAYVYNGGAVYAYDVHSGQQLFKLGPNSASTNALFGTDLKVNDGILAVCALRDPTNGVNAGLVYLFEATTGNLIRTIEPDDAQPEMLFGKSIALTDRYIYVGASNDDEAGPDSGAVYIFDYDGNQLDKVLSVDAGQSSAFGFAIDADDSSFIVGAPGAQTGGACYVFDAKTRQLTHTLLPENANNTGAFGTSLLLTGNYIAVAGRPKQGLSSPIGLYGSISGEHLARLVNSINPSSVEFGHALAADMHFIYAGDNLADPVGANSGAVSGFRYNCEPDFDNNYELDFFDISAFIIAYSEQAPAADFNHDGEFNFFDASEFINQFLAGCP